MSVYKFGIFSLDVSERWVKRNGRLVIIPDKLFDILTFLIENNGRVVTKEELMLKIWGDAAVEDSNLTVSISRIRKILAEGESQRKYILTFPRRGYCFIASVRRVESIVVVPSSSSDATGRLSHAVIRSEPAIVDRRSIGCSCVLSHRYSDEDAVGTVVKPAKDLDFVMHRPKSDEAYLNSLMGRHCWSKHTKEGLDWAIDHFQKALESDPNYLPTYMALVDCHLRLTTNYFLPALPHRHRSVTKQGIEVTGLSKECQNSLHLRSEWERAIAEKERRRAYQLGFQYPGVQQWHAAYIFSRATYRQASSRSKPNHRIHLRHGTPIPTSARRSLTASELLQISCMIARDQIEVGNFEAGFIMLQDWYELGDWPRVHGLSPESSADLLFTSGLLAGRLANSRQLPRGQIHAQALLNGALSLFLQLGLKTRVAECRSELGRCYDRQGLFDLARTNFLLVLDELATDASVLRSRTLLRLAFSEMKCGRLRDSLKILDGCSDLALANPSTAIFFHIEMAITTGELAIAETSHRYLYLAREHYRQALVKSAGVGHHHRTAVLENNYGYLLLAFGKLEQAESHLLRARELFDHIFNRCPELDETLARLHLERAQLDLAEQAIARSVAKLDACGEEEAVLAESLRTQGIVLARLNREREARSALDRAFQVAKGCGDTEGAGLALLIIFEEFHQQMEDCEQRALSTAIISLLAKTQRIGVLQRLEKLPKP